MILINTQCQNYFVRINRTVGKVVLSKFIVKLFVASFPGTLAISPTKQETACASVKVIDAAGPHQWGTNKNSRTNNALWCEKISALSDISKSRRSQKNQVQKMNDVFYEDSHNSFTLIKSLLL